MKILSYFVREEEQCTKKELFKKFCLSGETGEQFLSMLLQYGVLVPLKQNAAQPVFKFSFVGIVFFKNLTLRCYPKYIRSTDMARKAFAQVMNVLRRYGRESEAEYYPGGESASLEFSLIAEALALLDDYAEHGLYSNTVADAEYNGTGEILWDKTLISLDPFFCNAVPFYLDFHTKRTIDDTNDYVTRLHKHVLTECSRFLEDADLLPIFGLSPLWLSVEPREHFGPDDHILQRLRAELDNQFECHKQELLRRLIRFIERRETLTAQPLHLYGTTSFEAVWEKVCAKAFQNQLHTPLETLLPWELQPDYRKYTTLKSLIEKPEWHLDDSASFSGRGTLIPDIATFYCSQDKADIIFLILDAKYYCYTSSADKLPGIEDIDKQYLYELAFMPFLAAHKIKQVRNVFLLPTDGDEIVCKGDVEFKLFKGLGCQDIKLVLLPAVKVFSAFLDAATRDNFVPGLLRALEKYHLRRH